MNEMIVKEKEAKTGPGFLASEDAGHRFGAGRKNDGLGFRQAELPQVTGSVGRRPETCPAAMGESRG